MSHCEKEVVNDSQEFDCHQTYSPIDALAGEVVGEEKEEEEEEEEEEERSKRGMGVVVDKIKNKIQVYNAFMIVMDVSIYSYALSRIIYLC